MKLRIFVGNYKSKLDRLQTMKEYTNKEIAVYWNPEKCIHSANCVRCLPGVFNLKERPWINMKGASSEDIMEAIDKCPSGALSYKKAGDGQEPTRD